MAGKGLRRHVCPNPRLVVVELMAFTAIKHLNVSLASCKRICLRAASLAQSRWLEPTYPKNLEDVAVGLVTAKFITSAVKAEDELLGYGTWPHGWCVHGGVVWTRVEGCSKWKGL